MLGRTNETASDRFSRAIKKIAAWCRKFRHHPLADQHRTLRQKLLGHDAYFGITGNFPLLAKLRYVVGQVWRYWLSGRSRGHPMPWVRFNRLLRLFPLPPARVVHSVYRGAGEALT